MKDIKEKLNRKSKKEQLFILTLMFVALFGVFCVTGCGGKKSCETPKCGSEDYDGVTAIGCSIPGCGGCLTSGKGCNTACWPQSCKVVSISGKDEESSNGTVLKETACDVRYYGGGCGGCLQDEKSCYNGCITYKEGEDNANAFFYGSSDDEEKMIGCANGCGGCVASGGIGKSTMDEIEDMTGVK